MNNTSKDESNDQAGTDSAGSADQNNTSGDTSASGGDTANGGAGSNEIDEKIEAVTTQLTETATKLDAESSRREKAEKRIVKLKKKLKEAGVEDDDDDNDSTGATQQPNIEELVDKKIEERLAARQQTEESALARANRTIDELKTTIKSKAGGGNTSAGSNQDRYESEEDPTKGLSPGDRVLLERRASAAGTSLKEYLKKRKASS